MWWLIAILIVVGALLLVAELVLLPGITIAGIAALACYCGAGYIGYVSYGATGMIVTIAIVVTLSLLTIWFSLRAKTWDRFALKNNIESKSQESADQHIKIGERGIAITRLAPMGKVVIGGKTFEAKVVDTFLDQQSEVEVVGFENFNVIVKPI